jgi:hypothetical protein
MLLCGFRFFFFFIAKQTPCTPLPLATSMVQPGINSNFHHLPPERDTSWNIFTVTLSWSAKYHHLLSNVQITAEFFDIILPNTSQKRVKITTTGVSKLV